MSASPDRLQFGVNLYPQQWRDAARIEELGYDSVWTSEHIFFYFPTSDALTTSFREFKLRRDLGCPVCGENPTITEFIDYADFCAVAAGG